MHKSSLLAALILVAFVVAGCSDSTSSGSPGSDELTYTGTFLDLVSEEARSTPPKDGELKLSKVDKETGWCAVATISSGDTECLFPCMNYDGVQYQLRFENGRMTGYMIPGSKGIESLMSGEDIYSTDEETMIELFNEYVRQVDRFIAEKESQP